MTRREGLLALSLMFALLTAGATWLFGPYGLIGSAVLGAVAVLFGFERVERPRGEAVADDLPRDWRIEALERNLPL